MTAFRSHRSDPHFTVDGTSIFQHVDTSEGARALRMDAVAPLVKTNTNAKFDVQVSVKGGGPTGQAGGGRSVERRPRSRCG